MECSHFKSNLKIYVGCCNEYICCYICHDKTKHDFSYKKQIKHIMCTNCEWVCNKKDFSNHCFNCNIQFNRNYCSMCLLWHDFENYFHCDDGCGYCYVGKREDYIHCKTCDICIYHTKMDYHKCNQINERRDCYLCLEDLYPTRHDNRIFKCGHTMHRACYDRLYEAANKNTSAIKCGICRSSIA